MPPNPRRPARGFGLLEAIVALALLAGAGLALMAWINTSLEQLSRLERRDTETRARALALEWIRALDLVARPTGDTELEPGVRLHWSTRPLTPRTAVAPFPGGTHTPFEVELHEVEARITHPALPEALTLTQSRLAVRRETWTPFTLDAD